MSDPKWSRQTKNGRYYEDPQDQGGPLLMSVTNALNALAIPALAPAAAKVTAEAFMQRLPAAVKAARRPNTREAFLKEVKREHRNVWDRAMDLGGRVHTQAEAHALDAPVEYDAEVEPFVDQYTAWLKAWGVDLEEHVLATECTVLHRDHRYAGTADLWVLLPLGPGARPSRKRHPWLVDFKSSANPNKPASAIYPDNLFQLAALRHAQVAIGPDDQDYPLPEFVGAAILNLRPDAHAFIPLPADETAHAAFLGLLTTSYYLHGSDLKTHKPIDAPVVPEPTSARATTTTKRGAA